MRRVFLDVGGHIGETLAETVKPRWRFDRIYVFEPASSCLPALEALADARVEIIQAGWSAADGTADLFGAGAIGASIHQGKPVSSTEIETIRLVDCANWVTRHISTDDRVWAKINCEGAECDVLDRLGESGALKRIDHLLVHFDVEKIPGMAHRADETRRMLDASGIDWIEARSIMFGRSHGLKTANWVHWTEASGAGRFRSRWVNQAVFRSRQLVYPLKVRALGRR